MLANGSLHGKIFTIAGQRLLKASPIGCCGLVGKRTKKEQLQLTWNPLHDVLKRKYTFKFLISVQN